MPKSQYVLVSTVRRDEQTAVSSGGRLCCTRREALKTRCWLCRFRRRDRYRAPVECGVDCRPRSSPRSGRRLYSEPRKKEKIQRGLLLWLSCLCRCAVLRGGENADSSLDKKLDENHIFHDSRQSIITMEHGHFVFVFPFRPRGRGDVVIFFTVRNLMSRNREL